MWFLSSGLGVPFPTALDLKSGGLGESGLDNMFGGAACICMLCFILFFIDYIACPISHGIRFEICGFDGLMSR